MSESDSEAGIEGIVEDVKGKAKEAIGHPKNDDASADEGRAQQEEAGSACEVAEHDAQTAAAVRAIHDSEQGAPQHLD